MDDFGAISSVAIQLKDYKGNSPTVSPQSA